MAITPAGQPGPIIYNTNGNIVGMSYGAKAVHDVLPDEDSPGDVDYPMVCG